MKRITDGQEEKRKRGRPRGSTKGGVILSLSPDQIAHLFQEIRKNPSPYRRLRDEVALRLILHLGLRVSEASGLKRGDVSLETGEIRIQGKKHGSLRTYSLPDDIIALLKKWMKKSVAPGKSSLYRQDDGTLFGIGTGRFKFLFKKYARDAGLPSSLSIHGLRHSVATMMAERGASTLQISRYLRQRSPSSAEKYVRSLEFKDQDQKVAQMFKGIF